MAGTQSVQGSERSGLLSQSRVVLKRPAYPIVLIAALAAIRRRLWFKVDRRSRFVGAIGVGRDCGGSRLSVEVSVEMVGAISVWLD